MHVLHHTSGAPHPAERSVVLRLLRSTCWLFFANPVAIVVACLCLFLLGNVLLSIYQAQAAGIKWEASQVVNCASFIIAVTFLACLAIGHLALMWVAGWRSGRS
jgi:hypothetical protein